MLQASSTNGFPSFLSFSVEYYIDPNSIIYIGSNAKYIEGYVSDGIGIFSPIKTLRLSISFPNNVLHCTKLYIFLLFAIIDVS